MRKDGIVAVAFGILLVCVSASSAVAGYDDFRRIELAGQPADIFVTAGIGRDIETTIPYMITTRPDGGPWPPFYGSAGIAAGTVARGVTVFGAAGVASPPNQAVYIWSVTPAPGVVHEAPIRIRIAPTAPEGLAIIQLYSISDEWLTSFRPIGVLNVYIQSGGHPPTTFRMTTTRANVRQNWAVIDSPYTNGNPNARILVTHNWGGPGQCGCVYNTHPLGVWYTGSKWAVFNQDGAKMPTGTFFNVMIEGDQEVDGHVQLATASNTVREATYVNQEALNGNPNALLFVTPNWNPFSGYGRPYSGYGGYVNHNITVGYNGTRLWYSLFDGRWYPGMSDIMYVDGADVEPNRAFNTKAIGSGDNSSAFVHVVSASNMPNSSSNYTWITPSITDPNAVVLVTPRAQGGTLWMNHPVGVWYDGSRWAIFNEDFAPMHPGSAYNVIVPRLPEVY